MNKEEFIKHNEKLNKEGGNDTKVCIALSVVIDAIYRKYDGKEMTRELIHERSEQVADICKLGFLAFRNQVLSEVLRKLANDVGKPNFPIALGGLLVRAGMEADKATEEFMTEAQKQAPDRIGWEMTDPDDPRVSETPEVKSSEVKMEFGHVPHSGPLN